MQKNQSVSLSVIRRLPRYYRFLGDLLNSGMTRISSRELSQRMGLTASQIRQDLNCFGGFGQQGYGYNIAALHKEIGGILGLDSKYKTILIGAGNLGKAIGNQMNFETKGFHLIGVFDNNPNVIGSTVRGLPVMDINTLESFCEEHHPVVAMLCIPTPAAPAVSSRLIALDVKVFWNFTHYDIAFNNKDVVVENVHLSDSLMTLCYRVSQRQTK